MGFDKYIVEQMGLKSFDFFRKVQSEQQLSSSAGGIFTIMSLIVAAFLIFSSYQDFTRVQYRTSLAVKNDPNQYLPMKIDITFNQAPCQLITITFHDQLQYMEPLIEKKLNLSNIEADNQTPYIFSENREELIKRAQTGLDNNRQCRIQGTLNLPKTPGTLTFDMMGPDALTMALDNAKRAKVRASYFLKTMEFGDSSSNFDLPIAHQSPALQTYISGLEGDLKTRTFIQDFKGNQGRVNFYNHLKIIPIFIDDGTYVNEGDKQKYRFSLRAGNAPANTQAPKLQINTELEPINIVYKKQQMTVYQLCVDILAIVGGSVATIGVFNSIGHFLFGIK